MRKSELLNVTWWILVAIVILIQLTSCYIPQRDIGIYPPYVEAILVDEIPTCAD